MGRARRDARVFDAEGREVFVSQVCMKCRQTKPLKVFGLRVMADGKVRSIPWCSPCRSAASPRGPKPKQVQLPLVEACP